LKWDKLRAHIQLFIEKSKEVPFNIEHVDLTSPEGQQEAVRYLLVCGHIPFTVENLKFVKKEFHIFAEQLPDTLKRQVLELAMEKQSLDEESEWMYVEEEPIEELRVLSNKLNCVRIKDGKVVEAGIDQVREVKVSTRYDVRVDKEITE